ncbi:MAG: thioredoxin domain-containing protein, partial [Coprothermobacterota bacterium]|nr:thioredoxin domain-containing protein [Coprothermobacterota bacterium]
PCKMMQPILAELRQEYPGRLQVDFIDVWKNPEEAQRYQIQAIPTQLFFDQDGKEIFRHLGFYPKEDILARFAELGIDLTSP